MDKNVIELINVTKTYKKSGVDIAVLNNISYKFEKGKFYSIMGSSGSGKSTLINIICGLIKYDKGVIKYFDKTFTKMHDYDYLRNKKIGLIYQTFLLNDDLTSYENVLLPLLVDNKKRNNDDLVKKSLEKVGLASRMNHYPSELSGGEMQRVCVARALINNPVIILADEPTGNLDSKASDEIISLLKISNKKFNQTVIMITHDLEIAKEADRVITIEDGKIIRDENN